MLFPSIEEMKKAEKKHKGEDIGGRALTIRSYSYSSIGDYIVGTDTSVLVSVWTKKPFACTCTCTCTGVVFGKRFT